MADRTRTLAVPPNSTQLEIDLANGWNPPRMWRAQIDLMQRNKFADIADDAVPWLVWEYGLGELMPYLKDPRAALYSGVRWQRIRGTPASLKIAMEWVGLNVSIHQEPAWAVRWYWYQIDAGQVVEMKEVRDQIRNLAYLSQPARSELRRVFFRCDVRPAIIGDFRWGDGEHMIGDWSGVRLDGDDSTVWSICRINEAEGTSEGFASDSALIQRVPSVGYADLPLIWQETQVGNEYWMTGEAYYAGFTMAGEGSEVPGPWIPAPWPAAWGEGNPYVEAYHGTV